VDTFLAIASKRDTRRYTREPLPPQTERKILEAGRVAGSARNRQPWRFLVVDDRARRERLAQAVFVPDNVRGAAFVVALQARSSLDAGRCAENMMLAAWNEGVASCPNGFADPAAARAALGLGPDDELATVLTFGFPARVRAPETRTPDEWLERADRRPLEELVRRL